VLLSRLSGLAPNYSLAQHFKVLVQPFAHFLRPQAGFDSSAAWEAVSS